MRRAATSRAYSTSKPLSNNRGPFLPSRKGGHDATTDSSIDPNGTNVGEQETVDPDKYDERQASKYNSHEASVSPRPDLPLSPLMDPTYQAAKQKYTQRKAPPPKILTPFQERLAKNPYAKAIATPVRRCALTRVHLPSFFLIDFELLSHPTTSEPWYLPRSISSPSPPSVVAAIESSLPSFQSPMTESTPVSEEDSLSLTDHGKGTLPPSLTPHVPSRTHVIQGGRYGPRIYVLSRASLLLATVTPKSGFTSGWKDFLVPRFEAWKTAPSARKIRWRKDIDMLVLKLLRKRLVNGLKETSDRYGWCVVACEKGWTSVGQGGKKQLGAVLWFGKEEDNPDTVRGAPKQRGEVFKAVEEPEGCNLGELGEEEPEGDNPGEQGEMDSDEQEEEDLGELEQEGPREAKEDWTPGSLGAPAEFATIERKEGYSTKLPIYNMQVLLGEDHIEELRAFKPDLFQSELVALKSRKQTIDIQLQLWKIQGYMATHDEEV